MKTRGTFSKRTGAIRHSIAGATALFVISAFACHQPERGQNGPGKAGHPPAPVKTALSAKKDVPLRVDVVGNVEAYSSISITSQVGGQLEKIHFREGQQVKEGDLLVTIDPRPYKSAVDQAEAALARDTAQMENAAKEAARHEDLAQKGFVSQSQYEQLKTAAEALKSVLAADRAAVANAKLQLQYCYIHSPIGGQTGAILVNEGNTVKANDKTLVTVTQVDPLYVGFSVSQAHLQAIRKYRARGTLKVTALPAEGLPPQHGTLTFIDNSVDPATATIKLKAKFDNRDKILWPGQFVKVSLLLTTEKGLVTVPSQALQASQKGQFVYVVTPEGTADMRHVEVGRVFGDESVVLSGLAAGETVITDGQMQTVPGGKVNVTDNGGGPERPGK